MSVESTHDLTVGSTLELEAVEQAGGGYSWTCQVTDPAVVELAANVVHAAGSEQPGAAATRVFTLRALAPGEATVTLEHRRPWESRPAETRSVLIRVSAG